MSTDDAAAVNFSELVNKNKQTLDRLRDSPHLLLHRRDGEDLVLTTAARAEQDRTVVSAATRMLAAIARHEPGRTGLLLDILPDAFPWVRFLPDPDAHAFAVNLVDTMRAADSVGNTASVAQALTAWRHTAEAHSDPHLLAASSRNHEADYGAAPDPEHVA
ncbi:hypothetical protein [Streptomyces paromomycinus]|uniref:Prevent-host-death family protein n=1 Tax=Streptomyces paromomycinus TaxID=92743 RepID=A0A401W628_STREY|nr:hypothetical protein [Streptomyces paromomycinus]GCD44778.1 hypothetical protein GKJPGBOP_04492 [Streptomyces paromomycinus]